MNKRIAKKIVLKEASYGRMMYRYMTSWKAWVKLNRIRHQVERYELQGYIGARPNRPGLRKHVKRFNLLEDIRLLEESNWPNLIRRVPSSEIYPPSKIPYEP